MAQKSERDLRKKSLQKNHTLMQQGYENITITKAKRLALHYLYSSCFQLFIKGGINFTAGEFSFGNVLAPKIYF